MQCVAFALICTLFYCSPVNCREFQIGQRSHSIDSGYNIDGLLNQARVAQKESDINDDVAELLSLLPKSKIQLIFNTYIHQDPEVADNWAYIHTSEFQNLLGRVVGSKDFQKARAQLVKNGLNVEKIFRLLENLFIGETNNVVSPKIGTGLRGMLMAELRPLIPMSKVKMFAARKYLNSTKFRKMLETITDPQFKSSIGRLVNSKPLHDLEKHAAANRVNMNAIYEFVASFQMLYSYLMDVSNNS